MKHMQSTHGGDLPKLNFPEILDSPEVHLADVSQGCHTTLHAGTRPKAQVPILIFICIGPCSRSTHFNSTLAAELYTYSRCHEPLQLQRRICNMACRGIQVR